jgi:hypothetical protein
MERESIPSELEMLARAGYHFREGYTDKIRFAQIDMALPFPIHRVYTEGPYVLGPEEGKKLLFSRDLFNSLNTTDISQTENPGVIQVITQHVPMPKNKNNAGYMIHMLPETMPEGIDWKTFDLKTYNKLRYECFR